MACETALLSICHVTQALRIGTYHTLFVNCINTPLFDIGHLDIIERHHQAMHAGNLGRISAITVVFNMEGIPRIDAAARARMVEVAQSTHPFIFASAIVLEGTGLQTSMARSLITFLTMLSRRKSSHRVFDALEDGVAWLMQRPNQEPLLQQHAQVLAAEVRERLLMPGVDP